MLNAFAIRNASRLGLLGRDFSTGAPLPPRGWVPTPYVTETVVRAHLSRTFSVAGIDRDHSFNKSADHAREAVGEHVNSLVQKKKRSPSPFLEALKS